MAQTRRTSPDDRPRPTRRTDAPARRSRSDGAGRRPDATARTTRAAGPSRRSADATRRTSRSGARGDGRQRDVVDSSRLPAIAPLVLLGALAAILVFALASCVRSCVSGTREEPAAQADATEETEQPDEAAGADDAGDAVETDGDAAAQGATKEPADVGGPLKRHLYTSDPREGWGTGGIPVILQKDPQWAELPYADGTVGTHGCGPTALTMVYVGLTGDTSMDPPGMCAFSEENGYVEAGVTGWTLFDYGASQLGLTVHPVITTVTGLRQALEAGQVLVQDCDPGDFTEHGHFIVIVGIDENDQLEIRDPNSRRNTERKWDAQRVLDQHRNIWGFSYEG